MDKFTAEQIEDMANNLSITYAYTIGQDDERRTVDMLRAYAEHLREEELKCT